MDIPPDLPERAAVLERLFERMERRMERIEHRLDSIVADIARLEGAIRHLPTTWQLITYTLGAQLTFATLLFAAYRLGH
ncbi:MAG: hypothetical protein JO110_04940 [Acetobacteraceae bacterium]|nr:hypothetical protein [Acetobacteraceae bacterium]